MSTVSPLHASYTPKQTAHFWFPLASRDQNPVEQKQAASNAYWDQVWFCDPGS